MTFPYVKSRVVGHARDPEAQLDEIKGLASAIDLDIAYSEVTPVSAVRSATLYGKGALERIGRLIADLECAVCIVDAQLTPGQQRNLERAWSCKVIDRTALILEIFGARARTREGRMQVELAHQTYQRSRLVRSWTHLERQRGGAGFMGGPGETQIETDRRLIDQRITRLKRDLKDVKRTRQLHRAARKRVPYPVVALVGYTNAGKSTLFNRLTKAQVVAKDQLFATLDPTMRALTLPSGRSVILSDTVGFVSDLPHELVEAFHATLEEVEEADIIIHVRDIAHPDTEAQKNDVLNVLKELAHDNGEQRPSDAVHDNVPDIEVLNKTDLLKADAHDALLNRLVRAEDGGVALSAATGEGISRLLALIDSALAKNLEILNLDLQSDDGKKLSWLYDHGEVLERRDDEEGGVHLVIRMAPADIRRFERLYREGESPSQGQGL
ncbi:GTPase HflX [Varunaivibrio sulfuroxidans]|uniref:GTPase HflX n=1 Tax=Varunaivibrio sulfuroxidans TaxID=1773489 RepID=A0A4R3J8H9_9PROT|nr:GTPase HflX [Varunaivibrio sulfuroxidans]TCS61216.1 GTP-binding protein HflX [Varunaivibrio sulfuroxidans]WES31163.1 GTPase HflX [Varunaivibrio sulfuroxidans]